MPTYGYQCTQCQHEFSVFQSMKDAALTECPRCQGVIKRLLYPVGVVFKGSGWYINDSRQPEKSSEPDNAAKPETNGETKPASAPTATQPAQPAAADSKK